MPTTTRILVVVALLIVLGACSGGSADPAPAPTKRTTPDYVVVGKEISSARHARSGRDLPSVRIIFSLYGEDRSVEFWESDPCARVKVGEVLPIECR